MTDRLKPPVRLNLGGKTLSSIVSGLEALGWKTNTTTLKVNGDPEMICGNETEAKFRHPITTYGRGHLDTLLYAGEKLIRQCPDVGSEVLSTNEIV